MRRSPWIDRKESRWPELEEQGFRDLTINGNAYPPFDIEGINGALNEDGYAYGAGYGMYLKPTFLLGRIRSVAEVDGHRIYTTEREIVRDLFTSAAMLQGRIIFLRLEPLKALLWDKFAGIRAGCDAAVLHAFQIGGIRPGQSIDEDFSAKLDRLVLSYSGVLLHHELAESREAAPQCKEVLTQAGDRNAEHFLRAVQDLVADTSDVGPLHRIVVDQDQQSLSLMVGLLDGFRRFLFPGLREAYGRFLREGDWSIIEVARRSGADRFRGMRQKVIDLFQQGDSDSFSRGLQKLMQEPGLPDIRVEPLMLKVFPRNADASDGWVDRSPAKLATDLYFASSNLDPIRGTGWAFVNAVAEYVDHKVQYAGRDAFDTKANAILWGRGLAAKQRSLVVANTIRRGGGNGE